MTFCLDSWAVLALFQDEPAAAVVQQAVDDGAVMSWINAGELHYTVARRRGAESAELALDRLRTTVRLLPVPGELVVAAARIKAAYPMAYADAFAVATSLDQHTTLMTGDPEILDAGAGWPVHDLRSG